MGEQYLAHIKPLKDGAYIVQSAESHCRAAAEIAAECLKDIHLDEAAYLAGLLHDAGKFKEEFQDYLKNEKGRRGSVNHTFAGCRMMLEMFHGDEGLSYEDASCEIIAYAIGAHHGQFDCIGPDKKSGFRHRLEKRDIHYEESRDGFLSECAGRQELKERFLKAHRQLLPVYGFAAKRAGKDEDISFYLGLISRLILSAVIEGDRQDTARFMEDIKPPAPIEDYPVFWAKYSARLEEKLSKFPAETKLQKARAEISQLCSDFAKNPTNIYCLNVPTGAGKTLSSLRYALEHAKKYGKKRIICVTPLLAILDQNADVIRDTIGDDSIILEHHSNVIRTQDSENLDKRELAAESWDSPIIITTLVQLLNTMFLGKTASIRRFHALCNSVVIIDEVQTVPDFMLSLFNLAVNFLSNVCGTTFLLCSATLPCFDKADHPLIFPENRDVVPWQERLWSPFRRTVLKDTAPMRLDEIPLFAQEILRKSDSLLIICNSKREAEKLYHALSEHYSLCFHLSAAMCAAHRKAVLAQIFEALQNVGKTVCVSTQVMEAGVDISFQSVIRLSAGMDSVVQAAGRCNRNGENPDPAPVYLVPCADENLAMLREIQAGKKATESFLEAFHRNPDAFKNDLSSRESVQCCYEKLYKAEEYGYQDYTVKNPSCSIFNMLSGNTDFYDGDSPYYEKYILNQAFKSAGGRFCVFDNDTTDVVVPYREGEKLIQELLACPKPVSAAYLKNWSRRAKPYTIALYEVQKKKFADGLYEIEGVFALRPEYYDEKTGLFQNTDSIYLEV